MSIDESFLLQEVLLSLSLGRAEPARMPWGATGKVKAIRLVH